MAEFTKDELFNIARDKAEKLLRFIDKNLNTPGDVTVQEEVAEAMKHVENTRMRLGVAMTYHKGFDPFTSKPDAKRRK